MEFELLDRYCEKIFLLIAFQKEKMGFNELHRSLEKLGVGMSRPTLADHIKHLTKKKVLKKKKIGKQRVSYEVNWERFQQLLDARDLGKKLQDRLDDVQNFRNIPYNHLVIIADFTSRYVFLQQLRLNVLSTLNPEKAFDYYLEKMYISRYFQSYSGLLLDECEKDKEVGEHVLKLLESEINEYWAKIPDNIS